MINFKIVRFTDTDETIKYVVFRMESEPKVIYIRSWFLTKTKVGHEKVYKFLAKGGSEYFSSFVKTEALEVKDLQKLCGLEKFKSMEAAKQAIDDFVPEPIFIDLQVVA